MTEPDPPARRRGPASRRRPSPGRPSPGAGRRLLAALLVAAAATLLAGPADAEVLRVEITSREVVLDGRAFGQVGPYEKIRGRVWFGVDPDHPANARIAGLDRAPVEDDGLVHAVADFMILRPLRPERGSGVALLEVSNRGGKAALGYLNGGTFARDPSAPEDFGDGLLMRHGVTLIWVGWQWDVPAGDGDALRLEVPVARNPDGSPIRGLVRSDLVVDEPTGTMPVAHRGHRPYPVADTAAPEIRLTVRDGREAPRRTVPEEAWGWAEENDAGEMVPSRTSIHLPGGFEPGKIYELVYPAEDPRLVGLGLAAIRDMASWAKHGEEASGMGIDHVFALGISQTGRFLRHFLYQGFNVDEDGRRALDGMMVHTAGAGRGSFNHLFAQPSRDAHRFSAFFYPTDLFPFAGRVQRDTVTGRRDGLLALHAPEGDEGEAGGAPADGRADAAGPAGAGEGRVEGAGTAGLRSRGGEPGRYAPGAAGAFSEEAAAGFDRDPRHLPTVLYTNTGYEYWGRAASLLHTSPDGSADVPLHPKVRVYHLASAQHFPDRFPPPAERRITADDEPAAWRGNPMDFLVNLRALAVGMVDHLREGADLPRSRHPTVADGTLVPFAEVADGFPAIPGLELPRVIHVAYRADYGPGWPEGRVDEQPPGPGPAFPSLAPETDRFGNEVGGVRNVAVRVPLATYTPWSLRVGMPGPEGELADFRGTFAPLPRDRAAARRTGDPRPPVTSLYGSRSEYLERVRRAARSLVRDGFLLEEDVDRVAATAAERWDWLADRTGGS